MLAASIFVGVLAGAWSVVLPPGEGPDEPAHLGLVLHLADGKGYPDHDGLHMTDGLERFCATFVASVRVCPQPGEAVTATAVRVRGVDDAPGAADRPAWDDGGGRQPASELNQMPQHPPLYYAAMALVLRVGRLLAGGEMALDRELALLRMANVALVLPIPALAWATVLRLTGRATGARAEVAGVEAETGQPGEQTCGRDDLAGRPGVGISERSWAVAAALAVSGLPMLAATSGLLNNDNLLTLLAAAVAPLLASIATGGRGRGALVAAGCLIGLALLTKAFAIVLLPALALACWVGAGVGARGSGPDGGGRSELDLVEPGRSTTERVRAALGPLLLASGAAGAVSGWWYVRTWVRSGSPTPSVDADRYTVALRPPGFAPDLWHFADAFAGRFTERFWGSFGWYSARLPGPLTVVLTVVAVGLLAVGLASIRRRGPIVVLLVPSALLLALTASRAWTLHARSGQYPFIQGRYLLGGVVGLAVVSAVGWLRMVRARWSLLLLALVSVLLQSGALGRGLVTYWSGGGTGRLGALGAWSGLPDAVAVGLVLAVPAGASALLVSVWAVGADGRGEVEAPVPSASR